MIYRGKDSLVEALKSGALKGVEVDTSVYKKAHGKNPHGRGAWIFSSKAGVDPKKEEEGKDYILTVTDSYDAAVKKAKEWARKQKKTTIYLMEGKISESSSVVVDVEISSKEVNLSSVAEALKPKKAEWMKKLVEEKKPEPVKIVTEEVRKKDLSAFEKTLSETLIESIDPTSKIVIRREYDNITRRFKRK